MRNRYVRTAGIMLMMLLAISLFVSCSRGTSPNATATFTPGVDSRPGADPAKDSRPAAAIAPNAAAPDAPESRPGAGPAAQATQPKMVASAGETGKGRSKVTGESGTVEGKAVGPGAQGPVAMENKPGPAMGASASAGRAAMPQTSGKPAGPVVTPPSVESDGEPPILKAYTTIPAAGKDKIKDIEPGNRVKVSLYNDGERNGTDRWDRMKVDYNRNGRWDEKWSDMDGDGVFDRRQISTKDDETYDRELLLKNGRWMPKE